MFFMNALQKAGLHFRYRWVGLPLLISGGCLFLFSLSAYRETQDWFVCLLGFGCTMLGLTSFGVNHDTAIAYSIEAEKSESSELTSTMRMELDEDLQWDRSATLAVQATPKTALILPWCVIALQFYVFWRLMCVLTFPIAGKTAVCSLSFFNGPDQALSDPLPIVEPIQEVDSDESLEDSGLGDSADDNGDHE